MPEEDRLEQVPEEITLDEYQRRLEQVQRQMDGERLDVLLITSEDNYQYLTGFNSPTWQNLTRPRYCIVPNTGDPVLIVPSSQTVIAARTSWVKDVRSWVSPCPADDGLSLVVTALKDHLGNFDRVGAELGPESRLTMPVGDFLEIKQALEPAETVDCDWMLRKIRMIKSSAEVAHIRHIAQLVSRAFEHLPRHLHAGQTETEACRQFQMDLLRMGAEKIVYLVGTSGFGGYQSINLRPTETILEDGTVLIIDTGCSYKGYYCDFDREFAIGRPTDQMRLAYEIVWTATQAGIDAVRPGQRTSDIWQAQAASVSSQTGNKGNPFELTSTGRMGHGLGLRMCEPPSINRDDETVLEPGMVLTIEPGITFMGAGRDGPENKVLVHEENVVVTADGCDLLTRRAPPEMPVIESIG